MREEKKGRWFPYIKPTRRSNPMSITVNDEKYMLEKQPKKSNKNWKAEWNGVYYYITSGGGVDSIREDARDVDEYRYRTHNYYQTRELAQAALDKIEALARIDEYIEGNDLRIPADDVDWEDKKQGKYHISYYYDNNNDSWASLRVLNVKNVSQLCMIGNLKSQEGANQLIENMKDDLELLLKK